MHLTTALACFVLSLLGYGMHVSGLMWSMPDRHAVLGSVNTTRHRRCEPITVPFCKDLSYNQTIFPNSMGYVNQEHASMDVRQYITLVEMGCSADVKLFFCTMYVPACTFSHTIPPCRELCQSVRHGCENILGFFGDPWPSDYDCNQFPPSGAALCIGDNDNAREHAKNGMDVKGCSQDHYRSMPARSSFEVIDKYQPQKHICLPCDSECKGCWGPSAAKCNNCKNFKIFLDGAKLSRRSNTKSFICTSACPEALNETRYDGPSGPYCSDVPMGTHLRTGSVFDTPTRRIFMLIGASVGIVLILCTAATLSILKKRRERNNNNGIRETRGPWVPMREAIPTDMVPISRLQVETP